MLVLGGRTKPYVKVPPYFISYVEEMRMRIPADRFRREFEAEFVEEENCYLPMDLINRCID
jgi:hypothetical protein